ncbi:MAG: sigma 54-interacting transcriptional regulator, partial [Phycisphaeraceae bacterium]
MSTSHSHPQAATLGQLRSTGYRYRTVKQELRENLIVRLRSGQAVFPGIVGYEHTVLPQVIHAILSQHDMLFLGLRGQAKTRMLRMLPLLLDEWIPVLRDVEIPDDPIEPMTSMGKRIVREQGDDAAIRWLHQSERYHEKLATPDVTIADLIGEIDLIKHAEGRYLSDESTMHFGLIPRTNRGLFAINELPDLSPRIQVGLFNVLEERDIQIRGFPVRLNLDVCLAFSANPEDYTNRGRIVTPLKDRIGSVIRTHYPLSLDEAMKITIENAWTQRARASP